MAPTRSPQPPNFSTLAHTCCLFSRPTSLCRVSGSTLLVGTLSCRLAQALGVSWRGHRHPTPIAIRYTHRPMMGGAVDAGSSCRERTCPTLELLKPSYLIIHHSWMITSFIEVCPLTYIKVAAIFSASWYEPHQEQRAKQCQ